MRIGVGLSIPELATRGGRFSPASLFTSGVAGAWYDPSDYSTLFQDSAGTTPVTAVEQPVGLMLDKSQGLVLGSELVTGAASAYSGNGTVATVGDTITATCTTNGIYGITWVSSSVSNLWVLLTAEVVTNSASKSLLIFPNGNTSALAGGTTTGSKSFIAFAGTATGSTARPIFYINGLVGESFSIRLASIKSYPGNHALQATSASRPILRARYNLLTYSEQFDNAAWTKVGLNAFGSGSVVNTTATTDPLGGNTADYIQENTGSGGHDLRFSFSAISGASYTFSFYVKAAQRTRVALGSFTATASGYRGFDLSNGTTFSLVSTGLVEPAAYAIESIGNGWYRISVTNTAIATTTGGIQLSMISSGTNYIYTGDGTSGIYVWGADLRTGSSAGTYQRIAAATDYATAGFLPYLALDGTDDSFGTNSIDFSATDAMSVCVGVTKLSDSSAQMIAELSATLNTNNGTFYLLGPDSVSGNNYTYASKGTTSTTASASATSPVTNVITAQSKISTPLASMRKDGAASGSSSATQGTGNFGNYALFIGRRNNSTFPFNGRIYQLVVCGKTLSASELASTEAYVATKTGVTL